MSIIRLNHVTLSVGGKLILDDVCWQIPANSKMALVGRNGMGKSTLLHLLQQQHLPDKGELTYAASTRMASLSQEVPLAQDESIYACLVKQLGAVGQTLVYYQQALACNDLETLANLQPTMDEQQAWHIMPEIDKIATRLNIPTTGNLSSLSGGMKRRVLLAAALIAKPDILLLDEPTNHLDLVSIQWLESYLKSFTGSVIVVTHDRAFLSQVAQTIVEIDRGRLRQYDCDYATYLKRKAAFEAAEEKEHALFDKRLSQEEAWIRQGIKARRTRNEGRVRALKALRVARLARKQQMGRVKTLDADVSYSGQLVCETKALTYKINDACVIDNLSLLITRADKIGIIGPNGCGKTTLIRLLLKELTPISGSVRLGHGLEIAYFDQLRRQLDEEQTVLFNVADGADFVTIGGKQKHVASYLQDFLFTPERLHQKIHVLSGGERNRLLLARLFTKPVNLLVMDEPTNDLDIETLELLESMLSEYSGTLLLISHDRVFINQVVTSLLVWEEGRFNEYVGGFDDYEAQRKTVIPAVPTKKKADKPNPALKKLSYHEQRELADLPAQIEALEHTIAQKHAQMSAPDFYQQTPEALSAHASLLAADEAKLEVFYARWVQLEEDASNG